jgi:Na+/melibiose symporter-like transporter
VTLPPYINEDRREEVTGWKRRVLMSTGTILIIVLILLLVGVVPTWPHSRGWGYYPSGALGVILLIVIILLLMGRI